MKQTTSNILLVKPSNFGFNTQTASSNAFQKEIKDISSSSPLSFGGPNGFREGVRHVSDIALDEFGAFVKKLSEHGINPLVFDDSTVPIKPDAIFPNNWISMHEDGRVILYPMCAPNRRLERSKEIVDKLKESFIVKEVIDLSSYEDEGRFLEGTGSIIFDHTNRDAYACISPRTDETLFQEVCEILGYLPIAFHSSDENNLAIYHTNVMMCIGKDFAVICLETIKDNLERKHVTNSLEKSGHEIIDISIAQMKEFAGNMLALENNTGQKLLAMSQSAFDSLHNQQRNKLEKYATLLPLSINAIETTGGGSARCMMAEIFLPKK
ncbi:MAG: arginine deiminase-related protein [Ginsengibacter sp.]